MLLFQLLATIFIIFALSRIVNKYQLKRMPKSELIVWIVFWILIGIAVWWPSGTDLLAQAMGVSRGVDLILAASVAAIFYMLFQLFSSVHQLERNLTDLVRKLALEKHDEDESEKL